MNTQSKGDIDADQCQHPEENSTIRLWNRVDNPVATLILAHGAGAPMDSDFMQAMADLLAKQGLSLMRFEFPYMAERRISGTKRPPNVQKVLLQSWRKEVALVRQQVTGPVVLGGKSMGGRMASLLADELNACALVCLGYPFYAAGKPEKPRVEHLARLKTPTLIVQGERDALGNRQAVEGYRLAPSIELCWVKAADHDLKPLKSSGLSHAQALAQAAQAVGRFIRQTLGE